MGKWNQAAKNGWPSRGRGILSLPSGCPMLSTCPEIVERDLSSELTHSPSQQTNRHLYCTSALLSFFFIYLSVYVRVFVCVCERMDGCFAGMYICMFASVHAVGDAAKRLPSFHSYQERALGVLLRAREHRGDWRTVGNRSRPRRPN